VAITVLTFHVETFPKLTSTVSQPSPAVWERVRQWRLRCQHPQSLGRYLEVLERGSSRDHYRRSRLWAAERCEAEARNLVPSTVNTIRPSYRQWPTSFRRMLKLSRTLWDI